MNILTINASDHAVGGAARVAMTLHQQMLSSGQNSSVLVGKKRSTLPQVSEIRRPLILKAFSYLMANDIDFFLQNQVLRSQAFLEADIVHCHNLSGWFFNLDLLTKMSRIKPLVWTLHDMWALLPHTAYSSSDRIVGGLIEVSDKKMYPSMLWDNDRYLRQRKLKIYEDADIHIVSPCHWLDKQVEKTALGVKDRTVIYNGIDTAQYKPYAREQAKADLGLGSENIVMFVGASAKSNPIKGYAEFEWLAENWPDRSTQFVCVGAETTEMLGNVHQRAAVTSKEEMAMHLSAADIVVLPSSFEVFPLVMLEAMACGTPVIAYDVGGISELLAASPGCSVVNQGDRTALQQAIARALRQSEEEKASISLEVRSKIESEHSLEKMGADYLSLFQKLIATDRRVRT